MKQHVRTTTRGETIAAPRVLWTAGSSLESGRSPTSPSWPGLASSAARTLSLLTPGRLHWLVALAWLCLAPVWAAPSAREPAEVDVIIQANGATDVLSNTITSLGGQVRFLYRNVPAVAARVPAAQLSALAGLAGVTNVERDRLWYLDDALPPNPARPASFAIPQIVPQQIFAVDPSVWTSVPGSYANYLYTGAATIWDQTAAGAGSVVAVLDSGVARNTALLHAVIGAPGFPDGYNAYPDGTSATDPNNHWHGTAVAGVIAASAAVVLDDPTHPFYVSIVTHLPWVQPPAPSQPLVVPILGQAPGAKIYPVKIFPQDGGGTPTSVVLAGLDHILTLKKSRALDIDIVNLSLSGPTGSDGLSTLDRFLSELAKARILAIAAAGNDGPTPNTIGSPATSQSVVSVGALDYPLSSRVVYEWLGLVAGFGPGMGLVMRPSPEVRVASFSARGPLSDGRSGPDLSALGLWNLCVTPQDGLLWVNGSSFSCPAVAGVAALLNAVSQTSTQDTSPQLLEAALLRGADSDLVGPAWRSANSQGYGALNAPKALDSLRKRLAMPKPLRRAPLQATILTNRTALRTQVWTSDPLSLGPSQFVDTVLEVSRRTSKITIEVLDLQTPNNAAVAYSPNAFQIQLQSAKRTAVPAPVSFFWFPFFYGDQFTITIEDGPWTVADSPWTYQPMEPGLMKLTVGAALSNHDPVGGRLRVTRENNLRPLDHSFAHDTITQDDMLAFPVQIPAGTTTATFDLQWEQDWSRFPTSDLDLVVLDANGLPVSFDGATLNSPERVVLNSPPPGTYYLLVDGVEVREADEFELFIRLQ